MALRRKRREPVGIVVHDHGHGPEPCFRDDYAEKAGHDRSRGRGHGWGRGWTQWPVRALLGALTLSVVVVSGAAGIERYLSLKYMTPQAPLAHANITMSDQISWARRGQGLPDHAPPVVLTFHDVNRHSKSPYVLTPQAFDAQLTALEQAGYRTLSAKQFTNYMNGGPVPRRSVLITFDDGTDGLWKYADRILAKHKMHGTISLITGSMDKHRPYYLTWREIERMHRSGRWDFQSHTRAMHGMKQVDATGNTGAPLVNRLWLKDEGRRENPTEYRTRVVHDLAGSVKDITGHGMPAPSMFAIPFSDGPGQQDADSTDSQARHLLKELFPIVMTDHSSVPLTASRRSAAEGLVQRVEVVARTTPAQMLDRIGQNVQVSPDVRRPLSERENWGGRQTRTSFEVFLGKAPSSPLTPRYAKADYRPNSSVDWTDYRATALIGSLGNGTNQAALGVRTNSKEPMTVVLTRGRATLLADGYKVASQPLDPKSDHAVTVEVRRDTTTAHIDGRVKLSYASDKPSEQLSGGITIRSGINKDGNQWPVFRSLDISPLKGAESHG
ncbi:polysaccharide deacetylase family protein [Streptomyces triticiradicis]|uniref:Polysaccharide deacetylase family protein n=1 Tax=Streptomyces triticiradicis TaxID=2651189 RepID=A0A7J5D6P8_9ACTN|nr:polysaccharide deacetylase family protein [Streptomyces triticiradicis]KAB1980769.1 polysaccharide deacetylase family protein [Streptomyces triticiradicis]